MLEYINSFTTLYILLKIVFIYLTMSTMCIMYVEHSHPSLTSYIPLPLSPVHNKYLESLFGGSIRAAQLLIYP
jgi:maltodextrin utilization protein YvdJ